MLAAQVVEGEAKVTEGVVLEVVKLVRVVQVVVKVEAKVTVGGRGGGGGGQGAAFNTRLRFLPTSLP